MDIVYRNTDDVLCVRFSEAPVVKDVSYGWNVSLGYDADGQLAEITILDLSSVLSGKREEDESTLVLTERESRRLLELIESPPPRSEHLLAALARRRKWLRDNEPSLGADACAWMAHQASLLRGGALNDVQSEILATFFEEQVAAKRRDFEALVRRLLIDRWTLDHLASNDDMARQLGEFQARARDAQQASPSLQEAATARLEALWREARMALNHSSAIGENGTPELPENCPYTLEHVLAEAVPDESTEPLASDSNGGEGLTCITHITPVGGNIFLDLGFPPDEAERLKEESDRQISRKNDEVE